MEIKKICCIVNYTKKINKQKKIPLRNFTNYCYKIKVKLVIYQTQNSYQIYYHKIL